MYVCVCVCVHACIYTHIQIYLAERNRIAITCQVPFKIAVSSSEAEGRVLPPIPVQRQRVSLRPSTGHPRPDFAV